MFRQAAKLFYGCLALGLSASCASTPWYDNPPSIPLAVSPETDALLLSGESVTFSWTPSETAEHFDFHIFNATNSDIEQYYRRELKPANTCTVDTCSITLTVQLPESDRHAWRVRAGNVAGKSSWTRTLFAIVPISKPANAQ